MKKLFIHIPKTAGTSVLDITAKNKNYLCKLHDNIHTLNIQHISQFRTMFSFCIVRNPYERTISAYNFLKNKCANLNAIEKSYKIMLSKYETFMNFLEDLPILQTKIIHLVPQYKFVCDDQGNILVNSVIKMENLSELQIIDPIFVHLPHSNKSKKSMINLTQEMKQIIYNVYKKDFEIFQYSM